MKYLFVAALALMVGTEASAQPTKTLTEMIMDRVAQGGQVVLNKAEVLALSVPHVLHFHYQGNTTHTWTSTVSEYDNEASCTLAGKTNETLMSKDARIIKWACTKK